MAAARWSNQGASAAAAANSPDSSGSANGGSRRGSDEKRGHHTQSSYSREEIERMAEYSASLYAKSPEEKASYLDYYRKYYREGGKQDGDNRPEKSKGGGDKVVVVDGVEYKKYRKGPIFF